MSTYRPLLAQAELSLWRRQIRDPHLVRRRWRQHRRRRQQWLQGQVVQRSRSPRQSVSTVLMHCLLGHTVCCLPPASSLTIVVRDVIFVNNSLLVQVAMALLAVLELLAALAHQPVRDAPYPATHNLACTAMPTLTPQPHAHSQVETIPARAVTMTLRSQVTTGQTTMNMALHCGECQGGRVRCVALTHTVERTACPNHQYTQYHPLQALQGPPTVVLGVSAYAITVRTHRCTHHPHTPHA